MKEIKYTADGRKVVVIGQLNNTETIVQEIYVTEQGDEIPQGERFVVKSLLDAPVKSWKEIELARLEERFDKERNEWRKKIEEQDRRMAAEYKKLEVKVKWLHDVARQPFEDELKKILNDLAIFLSGKPTYVVRGYDVEPLDKYLDRVEYGSLPLMALCGNSEGHLSYNVASYGDFSGNKINLGMRLYDNYDDALDAVREKAMKNVALRRDSDYRSDFSTAVMRALELGCKVEQSDIDACKEYRTNLCDSRIADALKSLENYKQDKARFEEKFNKLTSKNNE